MKGPRETIPSVTRQLQRDEHERCQQSSLKGAAKSPNPGQIVLVLQGGGALGAYQAGVYQALHEAGIEPDWIIGTSIGAINASLIAGNQPQARLARLQEFWERMEQNPAWNFRGLAGLSGHDVLLVDGHPRHPGFLRTQCAGVPRRRMYPLGADQAGFYSTAPLEKTLTRARRLFDWSTSAGRG